MPNKIDNLKRRTGSVATWSLIGLNCLAPRLGLAQSAATLGPQSQGVSDAGTQLTEIVVTAEKTQSTAQRVPATIEVVNSDTLQRQQIMEFTDLNSVLNDTQIVPIIGETQIYIRGIGSSFIDPRADPVVATSVNGLFFARPLPYGFGFLDVARVEDLEGPQGTLYGRNSAAGAINIVTNRPTNEFGGSFQATGGNLGENDFTGVLNLPITDQLAVRIAADRDRRQGYIGDYYDGINNEAGRLSALYTPTDELSIYLETNYTRVGGHGGLTESWHCASSAPWSLVIPAACPPAGLLSGTAPLTGSQGSFVTAHQLQVEYNFGWATLTSILGYVGTHDRFDNLPNGSAFTATGRTDSNDYSEEVRLTGNDNAAHQGGIAWQVGSFFFQSSGDYYYAVQVPGSNFPPTGISTYPDIPQSSQAAYAQATYGLTDQLRITAGIRYTNDYKGITSAAYSYVPPTFSKLGPAVGGESSYAGDKLTYKGGLEYDLAPGKLLYATVSTGYVSGGANGGNPNAPLAPSVVASTFQPETITAYEVGSKNRFLDNHLELNGDVYHYNFRNYQYEYPALIQGGNPFDEGLQIQNAGSATATGIELSTAFLPTQNDRLSASVAWTESKFGPLAVDAFIPPFGPSTTIVVPPGSPFTNDPHWSGLVGYEHTWRLDKGSSVTLNADSKISGKYLLVVGSKDPDDIQNAYSMTDASAAYHWEGDKYILRLWVKNIENSPVNVYGQGQGFHLYEIEPPRTFGGTVAVKF